MARAPSLDEAVDLFLDQLKVERGLSVHTVEAYGRDLGRLLRELVGRGRARADEVTPLDVTEHLMALTTAKLAPRSRARALVAIRGLFRYLVAERYLEVDPTALIDAPKTGRRSPGVLGEEAVRTLLAQPRRDTPRGLRDAAMMELTYASGLRVSELVGLPIADLNLGAGVVRVTGKGKKTRLVPVSYTHLTLPTKRIV